MAQHRSGSGDLASRQPSQTHLPRLSTDESASEHSGAELVADVDGLSPDEGGLDAVEQDMFLKLNTVVLLRFLDSCCDYGGGGITPHRIEAVGPMGATWQALTRLESWCRRFTQQETDLQKKGGLQPKTSSIRRLLDARIVWPELTLPELLDQFERCSRAMAAHVDPQTGQPRPERVDIHELHTAVRPNLQCIVRSLRRPLRLKRSKAPGNTWKMRGMFSSDAWQSMLKVAGAATALVGVSAQVLLAGGSMEEARAAASRKASERWNSAAMLARRAMHLPQLAAELCVRGINAAQWNYQRDAAANNAWEDRMELLMDWSSAVVFLHAQMALRLAGYRATKQPGAILGEVVGMARSVGVVDRQGNLLSQAPAGIMSTPLFNKSEFVGLTIPDHRLAIGGFVGAYCLYQKIVRDLSDDTVIPRLVAVAGETSSGKTTMVGHLLGMSPAAIDNIEGVGVAVHTLLPRPYKLPGSNIVLVDMPGLGGIDHECKIARHYITASKNLFDAVVYLTPADAEIKAVHMEHLVSFSKAVGPALLCLTKTCQMAGIDDEPPKGVAGAIWNDVCLPWFDAFKERTQDVGDDAFIALHHVIPLDLAYKKRAVRDVKAYLEDWPHEENIIHRNVIMVLAAIITCANIKPRYGMASELVLHGDPKGPQLGEVGPWLPTTFARNHSGYNTGSDGHPTIEQACGDPQAQTVHRQQSTWTSRQPDREQQPAWEPEAALEQPADQHQQAGGFPVVEQAFQAVHGQDNLQRLGRTALYRDSRVKSRAEGREEHPSRGLHQEPQGRGRGEQARQPGEGLGQKDMPAHHHSTSLRGPSEQPAAEAAEAKTPPRRRRGITPPPKMRW